MQERVKREGMPTPAEIEDFSGFKAFLRRVNLSRREICREVYEAHRGAIKIKKEKTLAKNLLRIFDGALRISNEKGFRAMTMRSLSRETGMSTGALYGYFSGKEDLLEMLMSTGQRTTWHILRESMAQVSHPLEKLRVAVRTHLFLSEAMLPWFYFGYMEARHLDPRHKERAVAGELRTEQLFADILEEGVRMGIFAVSNPLLLASLIKAMVQDWYVKRWKYAKRGISVDRYAGQVIDFVEAYAISQEGQMKAPRRTPVARSERRRK